MPLNVALVQLHVHNSLSGSKKQLRKAKESNERESVTRQLVYSLLFVFGPNGHLHISLSVECHEVWCLRHKT